MLKAQWGLAFFLFFPFFLPLLPPVLPLPILFLSIIFLYFPLLPSFLYFSYAVSTPFLFLFLSYIVLSPPEGHLNKYIADLSQSKVFKIVCNFAAVINHQYSVYMCLAQGTVRTYSYIKVRERIVWVVGLIIHFLFFSFNYGILSVPLNKSW